MLACVRTNEFTICSIHNYIFGRHCGIVCTLHLERTVDLLACIFSFLVT